jgi:hypothetical protein
LNPVIYKYCKGMGFYGNWGNCYSRACYAESSIYTAILHTKRLEGLHDSSRYCSCLKTSFLDSLTILNVILCQCHNLTGLAPFYYCSTVYSITFHQILLFRLSNPGEHCSTERDTTNDFLGNVEQGNYSIV